MKRHARFISERDLRSKAFLKRARPISMLILDVDGVLTEGGIFMDEKGRESKCFSVRDGTAATLWRRAGFKLAIISGRKARVVEYRAREMGAVALYQEAVRKFKPYQEIKKKFRLSDKEIAYIGDDLHDIPIMKRAGLSVAVADAVEEVIPFAHLVTTSPGGRGAVREVVELILKAKGLWREVTARYYE